MERAEYDQIHCIKCSKIYQINLKTPDYLLLYRSTLYQTFKKLPNEFKDSWWLVAISVDHSIFQAPSQKLLPVVIDNENRDPHLFIRTKKRKDWHFSDLKWELMNTPQASGFFTEEDKERLWEKERMGNSKKTDCLFFLIKQGSWTCELTAIVTTCKKLNKLKLGKTPT